MFCKVVSPKSLCECPQIWYNLVFRDILDFSFDNESLEISGYYLIQSDHPSNKKHGGICIYYKNSLPLKVNDVRRVISRANFIAVYWYGHPKNVPKKQKVKLLRLTCLFVKRKFNETQKDFSINYPYNSNWVQVFKSGTSKICGRQPLKKLKGYGLLNQNMSLHIF